MKPYSGGIRHDYKDLKALVRTRRVRRALYFVAGLAVPLVLGTLLMPGPAGPQNTTAPVVVGPTKDVAPAPAPASNPAPPGASLAAADVKTTNVAAVAGVAAFAAPQGEIADAAEALLKLVVARGDTLDKLFRRNGLSLTDLAAMVALPAAAAELPNIKPGDRVEIAAREGQVLSLQRELDEIRLLSISRDDTGFRAEIVDRPVDLRIASAYGVVESSLYTDGGKAGLSQATIDGIYQRFKWDIDFFRDVREGDRFTVIYEENWRDGVKLSDGEVVAAEFINDGKVYRAARYTDGAGRKNWFTPDGRTLHKAFLRAPLDFTRVSSSFNLNRRHPVLNSIRAHRGVDYAAPTGTPVEAAGNGKIVERGTKGGYGNAIVIDHGGDITTLYGHLSRFARGLQVGSRVKQGDVIGYVGQTGLATGPHLHYEYRVQGVHKNPQTVPLPPAEPVPAQYRADFEIKTAPLWEQLDAFRPATVPVATTAASN